MTTSVLGVMGGFTETASLGANLFAVGIGVACWKRTVHGNMDGQNFPASGWGCHLVFTVESLPRPWIAWRGAHHEFGAGWKTHGGFGINWRRANATNATDEASESMGIRRKFIQLNVL